MNRLLRSLFLLYFLFLILMCRIFCTQKRNSKNLLIKTDRLGDTIIWQKIGFPSYTTVMRHDSLASDCPVNIYKLYLNPVYTWNIFKKIYGSYEKIYVLSSSKTAEMFAFAFLCRAPDKTTIQDDNGNMIFGSFLEHLFFKTILPNTQNEYSNVQMFLKYQNYKIEWESLQNRTVLFMPFASHERKEISFDQYKSILKKLNEYQISTYLIGLVSEERKEQYEKDLELYPLIHSKLNNIKLNQYSQFQDSIYLGMDTSIFHLLYNQKICAEYYVIMGLGYNFRFIPQNDQHIHCIYNHCNYSNCHWECKYSTTRCIKEINFDSME